jgi:hypothetical protein
VDELRIPIAHIQYIEVDSQSMVNKIAEECNVNPNEIEWPLIYCNGEPVGSITDLRNYSEQNSWLFKGDTSMLDSQNLLFESFPATPLGVSANRNDITNSGTMWSSNSSISSVDSEYLRSDIIGLLPDKEGAPPSVKLSKKLKNEQPVIDPEPATH